MKWIWTGFDFECTGHQIYLKDFPVSAKLTASDDFKRQITYCKEDVIFTHGIEELVEILLDQQKLWHCCWFWPTLPPMWNDFLFAGNPETGPVRPRGAIKHTGPSVSEHLSLGAWRWRAALLSRPGGALPVLYSQSFSMAFWWIWPVWIRLLREHAVIYLHLSQASCLLSFGPELHAWFIQNTDAFVSPSPSPENRKWLLLQ